MKREIKLEIEGSGFKMVNVYANGMFINSYVDVEVEEDEQYYYINKSKLHITLFDKEDTTIKYLGE
jgi:hypothetical protein